MYQNETKEDKKKYQIIKTRGDEFGLGDSLGLGGGDSIFNNIPKIGG